MPCRFYQTVSACSITYGVQKANFFEPLIPKLLQIDSTNDNNMCEIKQWRHNAHEKAVFDKLSQSSHYDTSKKLKELKLYAEKISIKGCSVIVEECWAAI